MSHLHTFLSKISKKRLVKEEKVDLQQNDYNTSEKDVGIDPSKPQLPKLIKYINAKQYFKELNEFY